MGFHSSSAVSHSHSIVKRKWKKVVIWALIWPHFLCFLYFASPEFLTSLKSKISVLTWIDFILCGSGINARGGVEVAYCIPKGMSPPYWSILHPAQLGNIYNMPKSPSWGTMSALGHTESCPLKPLWRWSSFLLLCSSWPFYQYCWIRKEPLRRSSIIWNIKYFLEAIQKRKTS